MWNLWRISFCATPYLVFATEWLMIAGGAGVRGPLLAVLTAAGLVAASKFTGFWILGGDAFNPELPVWLLYAWGWLESVVWIALPVGLCAAVSLKVWRFAAPRCAAMPTDRFAMWTVIAVSAALAAYGMWEGMRVPALRERTVEVDDLPPEFDGYRILHVSDLHCSSAAKRDKIAGIVARANSASPDLVAITGDFVDGFPAERERDLEPLRDLRAKDGVLACTGNHEKYWKISAWAPYYEKWGVRMLRNAWTEIRRGDASMVVGGRDDDAIDPHPVRIFDGAPEKSFRVLLYHRPHDCDEHERLYGVRLQLSGHTHGGAMPVIRHFIARFNQGHARGLYREGRLVLHNSPGSGQWAGFPLRLFNPPEITLLILKRKQ